MIKKFKFAWTAGLVAGLLGASGLANAQSSCDSLLSSYNFYIGISDFVSAEQYRTQHPECFGSSSNTAASAINLQATSLEQMLVISSNVSRRGATLTAPPGVVADSGERKGLAAGNPAGKWNVWASVAEVNAKYDRGVFTYNLADRTNKFDNRIENLVFGGDYQYAPNLALGLSLAFDSGRGSASSYNVLTPSAAKSVSTSGYSVAPYLGWQINKDWALDATIGWGNGKSTVAGTVTTDSKRFFYGVNANYTKWYGNWQVTGKGGYLFGEEDSADSKNNGAAMALTKVTNEVGQFRLGGQAAYWMNGVMPYFGLAYTADNRSSTASAAQQDATAMGKNAWVWSLGANFISLKNAMTGGIGYEQETGRSRSKNNKLMANINVRF